MSTRIGGSSVGEKVSFQLSDADAQATAGVFVAGIPTTRPQFPCGTCRYLLGPIMLGLSLSGGSARFASTIPCDMRLLNYDLDVQIIVVGTTASPRRMLPGLSASNILRAWVRD